MLNFFLYQKLICLERRVFIARKNSDVASQICLLMFELVDRTWPDVPGPAHHLMYQQLILWQKAMGKNTYLSYTYTYIHIEIRRGCENIVRK